MYETGEIYIYIESDNNISAVVVSFRDEEVLKRSKKKNLEIDGFGTPHSLKKK